MNKENPKGEIRITITGTRIYPYRRGQSWILENMTSIKERGFGGKLRKPMTGFLIPDDAEKDEHYGTFVTHLHSVSFLQDLFPDYVVRYDDMNNAKQLNHYIALNADVSPREVQTQILDQIMETHEKHQWFVNLSQGLGKTLLSVFLIPFFNTKTLIMCFSTSVLRQWYHTFRDRTNMNMDSVLLIDTGVLLDKIIDNTFPFWEYDIFMCTPKILNMYGQMHSFDLLSVLMDKMGIGMKIFDEAHRNVANIIKINAYTSVDKTLYLSGDYAQSNKRKETLYYRIFYDIPILKPTVVLMNTLKYTIAWAISYNTKPTEEQIRGVYRRRGFSFYDYMKYQTLQKEFYEAIWFVIDAINQTNENEYKILILVNMIEHVDTIANRIEDQYPERYIIARYHSKIDPEEKELAKKSANLIVSTHLSFGVGIDVNKIKYVINCCISTKIDDNQASGRARPLPDGSDAHYFMLYDRGFPYARKTIDTRLAYLEETKIKATRNIKL